MSRPTVICLTLVRNEASNLDRFLRCASLWADRSIIGDHGSQDGSRDIARRYPKVVLLEHDPKVFDEGRRRAHLVEAARRHSEPRLLIGLDADEILTAAVLDSPEWGQMLDAAPGTVMRLDWVNLLPGFEQCWSGHWYGQKAVGFMDDGSPFVGLTIHSKRVPVSRSGPRLTLKDIKILHYAFIDPDLRDSKFRFYMCIEELLADGPRPMAAYRQYLRARGRATRPAYQLPVESRWFEAYEKLGIEVRGFDRPQSYWFDREVLRYLMEHSPGRFRAAPIWGPDWPSMARSLGIELRDASVKDPRGPFHKLLHLYLKMTQPLIDGQLHRVFGKLDFWMHRTRSRRVRFNCS